MLQPARSFLVASLLLAFSPVAAAFPTADYRYQVLLDTDGSSSTGCAVAVQDLGFGGTVSGVEQVVTLHVAWSPTATVARISRSACLGGAMVAQPDVSSGRWPVGIGNGTGGGHVIEGMVPLSLLGLDPYKRQQFGISFSATVSGASDVMAASFGAGSASSVPFAFGQDSAPIPALGIAGVAGLALLVSLLGIVLLRGRAVFPLAVLLALLAATAAYAAVFAMDGQVGDWAGIAPIVTDPAGDSSSHDPKEDMVAGFAAADATNLYVRIDVSAGKLLTVQTGGAGAGTISSDVPVAGAISCGSACTHLYDDGTQVTLTAAAGSTSTFSSWSVAGSPGTCAGTGSCVVTMSAAQTVTAAFVLLPTCTDGVKNGTETDVDCGGTCGPCATGKACGLRGDCASGVCSGGVCQAPTCTDTVKNGTETDIDCGGGNCPTCALGKACAVAGDCASGSCSGGVCVVPAPTCTDTVKNGTETDVDCGGGNCPTCANGQACVVGGDCGSGICYLSTCRSSCPVSMRPQGGTCVPVVN